MAERLMCCYCGKEGHLAKDCPLRIRAAGGPPHKHPDRPSESLPTARLAWDHEHKHWHPTDWS